MADRKIKTTTGPHIFRLQLLAGFSLKFTELQIPGGLSDALHSLDRAGHMSRQDMKLPTLSDSASTPCPLPYKCIIIALTLYMFEFLHLKKIVFLLCKFEITI